MKPGIIFLILLLAAGLVFAAGCSQPALQENNRTSVMTTAAASASPSPPVTPPDLIARVKEAITYAREHGREKATAAFNDPAGQFARGRIYVFAEDYNGTALAEPFEPELVGTDVRNI